MGAIVKVLACKIIVISDPSHYIKFTLSNTYCSRCLASRSMEFSKQEYWNMLPCPPPAGHPNPRIEPACTTISPAWLGGFILYH